MLLLRCVCCHRSGMKMLGSRVMLCQDCFELLPWMDASCIQCGRVMATHLLQRLCGRCLLHPPHYDATHAVFNYTHRVPQWIAMLKFSQQLYIAKLLGACMWQRAHRMKWPVPDAFLPVPLHAKRLRFRGFNQSLLVALVVARFFKRPVLRHHAVRVRYTEPQVQLSVHRRKTNVSKCFSVVKKVPYQHVAIIDDVMTTGHTCEQLAVALKQSGVKKVSIWCCSRA